MGDLLKNKKVAILVTDGFEQSEMTEPRKALSAEGAATHIVSPHAGMVKAWRHGRWGDEFHVEQTLDQSNPVDFDALLLPGGVMNPDKLRMNVQAVEFVRHFVSQNKPIAAICHGPWTLIEADAIRGRTVTSWPSLKSDIRNAGGKWVDQETAVDGAVLTSRKPDDIPAFNKKMIELIRGGIAGKQGQEVA